MSELKKRSRSSKTGQYSGRSGGRTTESRQEQISRITASRQSRRSSNKKRRRRSQNRMQILIAAAAVLVVVVIGVSLGKKPKGKAETDVKASTETETETMLKKEVLVDDVSITNMMREEAREKILKYIGFGMKVVYNGEEYEMNNLMEPKVDEVLDEIYHGTGEIKESYSLSVDGLDEAIQAEVAAVAKKWDVPAKNGAISSFDAQAGKFIFTKEEIGKVINQEKLASDIKAALEKKDFNASITATAEEKIPEISEAQAREKYKTIGTFTTKTTSNKDRNTNIEIAVKALNGIIIQPGQEFSFNTTTGNRTTDKGYRPAGAYVNGVLVEEPGGGVCQVSSTLYNAVVFSGLKTTERHAHSYEPSYVTPGEDAMVSYDGFAGPDMKFINNSKDAVGIRASFSNQKLTLSIYGIPILDEGVTLQMKSEKVSVLDPPAPTYEEDQTLQLDETKEVKKAVNGCKWVTNLITKKNGEVISDEFLHNSTYKGKSATIKRNTSGVVVPASTEAAETSESESPAETVPGESQTQAPETTAPVNGPGDIPPTTTPAPTQTPTESAPAGPAGDIIAPNPLSETINN